MEETVTLKLMADAGPLLLLLEILRQIGPGLDLSDPGFEIARVECVDSSALGAGESLVRFYPSDGLLRLAATLGAGQIDARAVKDALHV